MTWYEALFWLVVIYLLPSMVAFRRRSGWRSLCYFCNVFFGWTLLGWFAAWFLAFHDSERRDPHPPFWHSHSQFGE